MSALIQFANDRPTSLNDDLYQWVVDAEEHIRALATEQENVRKANLDCVDHFNQLKADYDELNAKLNAITTEAETNQKWAFLEWRNKAEELQDERDTLCIQLQHTTMAAEAEAKEVDERNAVLVKLRAQNQALTKQLEDADYLIRAFENGCDANDYARDIDDYRTDINET